MKKTRRQALKSFFGLGFVSFIPIRIIADNECNPTTSDILGPYFIEGVPNLQVIAPNDGNTNRLFITGTVYANDCITPIPNVLICLLYTSPSPRDRQKSRMPSSA